MPADRPNFEATYSHRVPRLSSETPSATARGIVRADSEEQAKAIVSRGLQLVAHWQEMIRMGITPGAVRSDPSNTTVVEALWEGKGQSSASLRR